MNIIKKNFFHIRRRYREYKMLRVVASHKNEIFVSGKNFPTSLSRNTHLSHNPNFNGMSIKGNGHVYIGNNFHSGEGCLILTSNHNYNGKAIPYDDTNINKDVVIEDNVWLGDRVIILGGVKIGEGVIIQAGAVVVNDIPALAIAGGNPAKIFKYRDAKHYWELKKLKKFH